MRKGLLLFVSIIIFYYSNTYCQRSSGKASFIDSMQGTWAYTEPGAGLWIKVEIKGRNLKGYAAYPESGKFITESVHKLREVRLVYKSNINRNIKTESFAQIRKPTLTSDRLYIYYEGDKPYLVFGEKNSPKLVRVSADFDPWM